MTKFSCESCGKKAGRYYPVGGTCRSPKTHRICYKCYRIYKKDEKEFHEFVARDIAEFSVSLAKASAKLSVMGG